MSDLEAPDKAKALPGSYREAPCGCSFWVQATATGNAFVTRPCAPDCALWNMVQAKNESSLPVETFYDEAGKYGPPLPGHGSGHVTDG